MTAAIRSPGSALKPFIYGIAFEDGLAHPETLIEDRPVRFDTYAPMNFDSAFHGTVTVRTALQLSLNVPAVKVLNEVGPVKLAARFRDAGMTFPVPRNRPWRWAASGFRSKTSARSIWRWPGAAA